MNTIAAYFLMIMVSAGGRGGVGITTIPMYDEATCQEQLKLINEELRWRYRRYASALCIRTGM